MTVQDILSRSHLGESSAASSNIEEPSLPLVQMVWLPFDPESSTFETSEDALKLLLATSHLDLAFRYGLCCPGGLARLPVPTTEEECLLVFAFSSRGSYGACWAHDLIKQQTFCVYFGSPGYISGIQDILKDHDFIAQHAMFPAILIAQIFEQDAWMRSIGELRGYIEDVEARTKHSGWALGRTQAAQGSYATLSATMGGSAAKLASLARQADIQRSLLADIEAYHDQADSKSVQGDLMGRNAVVKECVMVMKHRLSGLQAEIPKLSRQCDLQLTVLFHLITSKESRISIAIAEESRTLASATKEDSTAMKTLALVTVVFLPGTFVSAFFAVPLFQWDAGSGDPVLLNRFWIYWAVTLPLTLMTVIPWIIFTRAKNSAHRNELERAKGKFTKAMEGLGQDLEDDEKAALESSPVLATASKTHGNGFSRLRRKIIRRENQQSV